MDGQHKNPDDPKSGVPIREDSAVDIAINSETDRPEIVSVKPIFRPPERSSEPVKPYWKWIWIIVVVLVVLTWVFLYWYFTRHHAPYSAPLR